MGKSKRPRPLNKREKALFKYLAANETPRQAAILAGYSPKSASSMAKIVTQKYSSKWNELLAQAGADDTFFATTIVNGMQATTLLGKLAREWPDHQARARFTDIGLKVKDAYPATKHANADGSNLPAVGLWPDPDKAPKEEIIKAQQEYARK